MEKTTRTDQRGFTLVELLAVIVILGVIAAIAVPAIGNVISKSKDDARDQSILLVRDAAETYMLSNEAPADFTVGDLVTGGFLRSVPTDPATGTTMETWKITTNGKQVTAVGSYAIDGSTVTPASGTGM